MANVDISSEIAAISSAVYGEEVRGSIKSALQKMVTELNTAIGTQVIDRASVEDLVNSEALSLKYSTYTEITSGSDLNAFAGTANNYWIPYTKAQALSNMPVVQSGRLFVFPAKGSGANDDGGLQVFATSQTAGNAEIWFRGWKGSSWTTWKKVAAGDGLDNLKNEVTTLSIGVNLLFPVYDSFERITWDTVNNQWISSTTRIASRTILYTQKQMFIHADSGYKFAYNSYNSSGVYQSGTGWKTGDYVIDAGTYFCVILAKSNDAAIQVDEAHHVYLSIKDDLRAIKQTSIVYGTSGTSADPTIVKNGTDLTVTLPSRMFILGHDFTIYTKDFSGAQTFTVPHNSILYYNFDTQTVQTMPYANLRLTFSSNISILLYNNNGKPIGQLEKYFDKVTKTDLQYLMSTGIEVDTNGENAISVSTCSATSETITVIIPTRIFVIGYKNTIDAVDSSSIQRFEVQHNYVLYLDLTNNTYYKVTYANYANVVNDHVLLVYNNHGMAIGALSKYQKAIYAADNFKTTIFCSRQGDIDGCPENSLIGIKRAKMFGYNRVRVSVSFTADNIPVCFHDEYLGTNGIVYDSNGNVVTDLTKKINEYTYSELQAYDFGRYRGTLYTGTKIAKLESVILLCRNLGCELDIETKFGWNTTNLTTAYNMVALGGMLPHTLWVSDTISNLETLISINDTVSVAYGTTVSTQRINRAVSLKTGHNEVWIALLDTDYNNLTDELRMTAINQGIKFKYCSVYNLYSIPANVLKCEMVEVAYMKYPSFYVMKGN